MYEDLHSFAAFTIFVNKEEFKIILKYFFYWLNIIVWEIFLNQVKQLFLYLETSFIKQRKNDNLKTRCLLVFLKEAEYINKVIYA